MHRFWSTIIEPVLEVLQPGTIVEIGASDGTNTANLLEFCERHGATLHAIDPLPKFDVASYQQRYGERFIFHRALSLDAIPVIDRFDAVLIDGDHNWYTVFNELKLIEKSCAASSHPFPIIMLHDIGWPYGRRDLYYNPENIPEAFRKPYRQRGIRPGLAKVVEEGGLNPHLLNATIEGNSQNGVLTAVEDFLSEIEQKLELVELPGLNGFALLFPMQVKEKKPAMAPLLQDFDLTPFARKYVDLIEEVRVRTEILRSERISALKSTLKTEIEKRSNIIEQQTASLKKQSRDIDRLIRWIDELNLGISALLNSWRWRCGNAIGEIRRKLLSRPKVPMASDHLLKIIRRVHRWKKHYKQGKDQSLSQRYVPAAGDPNLIAGGGGGWLETPPPPHFRVLLVLTL